MKYLLSIAWLLMAFTSKHGAATAPRLSCVLTADKQVYKTGELPKLTVSIRNNSKENIYLIGSLDGSDVQWRYPHCYFTIDQPQPNTVHAQRCGTMNTLRLQDFACVKAGGVFNPYQQIDGYGFFSDYTTTQAETFKQPGVYKIRFHYSTNTTGISQFMGSGQLRRQTADSLQLDSLFKAVPRVELTSNEIVITITQ